MIKVAACQYHIDLLTSWDAYAEHLTELCEDAAGQGAELLLLPEYAGLVLTGQLPETQRSDLHGSIAGIQPLLPREVRLQLQQVRPWGPALLIGLIVVSFATGGAIDPLGWVIRTVSDFVFTLIG